VPGFTAGILSIAKQLSYSPQWVISSVGSDPTLVNNAGEVGAISLDYFPAPTNTKDAWVPWLRKVLLADKADFPSFTASSVLTGNEFYGAAYAVAFAETLKAEGKNVTRAGFMKTLKSTTLNTPAITPLKYSSSNHQGLLGGVIATIPSNGGAAPTVIVEPNTTVFSTHNTKSSPITVSKTLDITAIPNWLK
jgi:branched-chain amino acid transport system substrate-binding protein